jgi:hypothetical protein
LHNGALNISPSTIECAAGGRQLSSKDTSFFPIGKKSIAKNVCKDGKEQSTQAFVAGDGRE